MNAQTFSLVVVYPGVTTSWSVDLSDFPAADGLVLRYRILRPAGCGSPIDIQTIATGDVRTAMIAPEMSANWIPGDATLVSIVERTVDGSIENQIIGSARLRIGANLLLAENHDPRSANQIALDDAKAALAAYQMSDGMTSEYSIGDRSVKFRSLQEILELINHYQRMVNAERIDFAPRIYYRG